MKSKYHTITLIPHTDVARPNITPVAINLNITRNLTIKTGFFEYIPNNITHNIHSENSAPKDNSYIEKIIKMNPEYTDSRNIILEDWNKYYEVSLDEGDISIYQGDYYHAPILESYSTELMRVSIAIFLIYGDTIVSSISKSKQKQNLGIRNIKDLRGYKLVY